MSHACRPGIWVTCALLLLCAITPRHVAAQPDQLEWRNAETISALVENLDDWIDVHSEYARHPDAPEIQWINRAQAARLQTTAQTAKLETTRGLYDPEAGTIYLVRPWDRRKPYDVSVLLHELIHHRQTKTGHWYCPGAQEQDAYKLQDAWLAQLGLRADVNWIAVILEAGCTPKDIHPD